MVAAFLATAACSDSTGTGTGVVPPQLQVVSATGDITAVVDAFRTLLGPSNGVVAGEPPAGRREINWDRAGALPFNNTNSFPADFFNTTVKAGAVFTTAGTGFRNDSTSFKDINPDYAAQFTFFSPSQIFAPVGSNEFDVVFQVAGQPTPAVVTGFGVVLSDVDVANATTIELFAQDGSSLGTVAAPARSGARGLSFVGAKLDQAHIARVRITLGTGALGAGVANISAGGTLDLAVVDNLVYGEPKSAF